MASTVCSLLHPLHPSEGNAEDPPHTAQPRAWGCKATREKAEMLPRERWLHPAKLVFAKHGAERTQRQALSASPWGNTLRHRPSCPADSCFCSQPHAKTYFLQPVTCKSIFLLGSETQKP